MSTTPYYRPEPCLHEDGDDGIPPWDGCHWSRAIARNNPICGSWCARMEDANEAASYYRPTLGPESRFTYGWNA